MSTPSSTSAHRALSELKMLAPEKARTLIMLLLPCLREEHREDFMAAFNRADYIISPQDVFNTICECVSAVTGVPNIQHSKTRHRHVVRARQYVIWIMLAELRGTDLLTYAQLGHMFKHQYNHATIVHARKSIEDLLMTDRDTRDMFKHLTELLTAHGYERSKYQLEKINIIR
jgi:hypothetical protein